MPTASLPGLRSTPGSLEEPPAVRLKELAKLRRRVSLHVAPAHFPVHTRPIEGHNEIEVISKFKKALKH